MPMEKTERAQQVFKTLCDALNCREWRYDKEEENLTIRTEVRGEDLPIGLMIKVDAGRQLVSLISRLPLTTPEDKRIDVAIATSIVNYSLVDGSFDYNINDGTMFFRLTNSFIESDISREVLDFMIEFSCYFIDKYNDKFFMLTKGLIKIEDFLTPDE